MEGPRDNALRAVDIFALLGGERPRQDRPQRIRPPKQCAKRSFKGSKAAKRATRNGGNPAKAGRQ